MYNGSFIHRIPVKAGRASTCNIDAKRRRTILCRVLRTGCLSFITSSAHQICSNACGTFILDKSIKSRNTGSCLCTGQARQELHSLLYCLIKSFLPLLLGLACLLLVFKCHWSPSQPFRLGHLQGSNWLGFSASSVAVASKCL